MITISDIAAKAGVSRATVSYVLNGRTEAARISEHTRIRVLETAQQLGYRRNELARAVTTGDSRTIGFWVMQSQHEPVVRVLAGAMKEADENDYFIKMLGFDNNAAAERIVEQCIEWRLTGIIAIHAPLTALDRLNQYAVAPFPIPIIAVDSQGPWANGVHITSDQNLGVKQIIDYLAKLGHQRIAYITGGAEAGELLSHRRANAYRHAMFELDLSEFENVIYGNWDVQRTQEETRRLLTLPYESKLRPTAIACWSDITAMVVVRTAAKMGIRIPDELSVAGFDDLAGSALYNPSLTTVTQSFDPMGRLAVRRILDSFKHKQDLSDIPTQAAEELLPTCLIVRESTGHPPLSLR